jgi:SH3 domain protein
MRRLFAFLSLLVLVPAVALGKSLYVRDTTKEALVRSGPNLANKILVILKPGQEVILEREEGNYYVVTTPNGVRGYVLKYLMTDRGPAGVPLRTAEPPAPPSAAETRLREIEQQTQERIAALEARTQEQEKALTTLREERDRLAAAKKQAEATASQQAELAAQLQTQQSAAQGDEARLWFLSGAGVLLVGFVLGWMWGASSRRYRRSSLSLDRF